MTTKITVTNDESSNGDVIIRNASTWMGHAKPEGGALRVLPGDKAEIGITDASIVVITEEFPTTKQAAPAPVPENTG